MSARYISPVVNLADYLSRHRGAANALAREAGVSKGALSSIRSGKSRPSAELAKRIEHATGGEVTAASLLGLESGASARSHRLYDGRWIVWASDRDDVPVPTAVVKDLGIEPGEPVVFRRTDRGWELTSAKRDLRGVQELARKFVHPGSSIVDELIAERRADAERE
ncbi:MAG TPA: helix-turn-helix domain-containing protein [Caulobacteraceae bacterium]